MTRRRGADADEVADAAHDWRLLAARTATRAGNWEAQARCRSVDPEVFFSDASKPALRHCRRCPVSDSCLATALDMGSNTDGVWGGTTARDREAMIYVWRQRRAATTSG